ncbi:MAG: hypothetical protein PHH54_00175 [Candidatus Nanoarchaeia archaeon]|nr:hypothetical protein [Candidatus Nanoarchaeia archaeon]MDD5740378.1 hypothetical protein [Candidatus Nanoarchaeia archaeon]
MSEVLEKIIKEKISADHLLYVSLKYTKTCDVMINLIKRWKIMIDYSIDGLLDKAKKKKLIKKVPTAPKLKIDEMREVFKKKPEIIQAIDIYDMFKLIDLLQKTKESEFRKGVCLKIQYRGQEVKVDLEKLKEYSEILERFINQTKLFLSEKN